MRSLPLTTTTMMSDIVDSSLNVDRICEHVVEIICHQAASPPAWIIQSYSPGGANVHRRLMQGGPTRVCARKGHLDRFIRFCGAHWRAQHQHRQTQTKKRATTLDRNTGNWPWPHLCCACNAAYKGVSPLLCRSS